jgi:hypothetical protein
LAIEKPAGVYIFPCANTGGATVPAGTPVSVWIGWFEVNPGLVRDFLTAQTTTLSIDGVPVAGASGFWGPVGYYEPIDASASVWTYSTGRTLAAGESVVITVDVQLSRKLKQGKADGKSVFIGPGSAIHGPLTCTVTAV